jgi:hypothetical protein
MIEPQGFSSFSFLCRDIDRAIALASRPGVRSACITDVTEPAPPSAEQLRYFHNDDDGHFAERTQEAGNGRVGGNDHEWSPREVLQVGLVQV